MSTRICIAGVTGEVGRLLASEILTQDDLTLTSAVARSAAGQKVGQVIGRECDVEIRASVAEALARDSFDVLVDYTSAKVAFENVHAAVAGGKHVVVGSSGITAEQYAIAWRNRAGHASACDGARVRVRGDIRARS